MEKPCKHSTEGRIVANGYYAYGHGENRGKYVHKVLYEEFNVLEPGEEVRHTCNNRWCVELTHLIKGTRKDNVQDAIDAGTHISVKLRKLSDEEVQEIRDSTLSQKELAKLYNVSIAQVSRIRNNKRRV